MTKTAKNSLIIASALAPFILFFAADFYNRYYNNMVRHQPKMYCYETYRGVVNAAFFVQNESLTDSLVKYYTQLENRTSEEPTFNFPPLTIPTDTCVYVIGYSSDSTVADIICYHKWSRNVTYERGYVYANTLHINPPQKVNH